MRTGFYEVDITPHLGSVIPGDFAPRYADGILHKLYSRAAVFDNGKDTVALVSVDACGITADVTEKIRARVLKNSGIPADNVIVMATHTHGGGPVFNWGEAVKKDDEYLEFLINRSADAICMAKINMRESEIVTGREELRGFSFVRIYKMKDGSLRTFLPKSEIDKSVGHFTDIDPELSCLAVKQDGRFIGAIINYATHPASMATTVITGDFISILSERMKAEFGENFVSLFITGACGDINNVNCYDLNRTREDSYVKPGIEIAKSAIRVMNSGNIMTSEELISVNSSVTVRFRKPTKEQILAAHEYLEGRGDELIDSIAGKDPLYQKTHFALQALLVMADKRTLTEVPVHVMKIGDVYVAGTGGQIFNKFGKMIKAAADGICFVSAFANDYSGYVPTPECMVPGVYEATLSKTSALEAAAGDKIVGAFTEIFKSISK